MQTSTILNHISAEQVYDLFEKLQKEITALKEKYEPKAPEELMTRTEVAEFLKCDLSTIHNWTKSGKLKAHGIGYRVYYKRSEINAGLIPLNSI